jgi:hypothetical protein
MEIIKKSYDDINSQISLFSNKNNYNFENSHDNINYIHNNINDIINNDESRKNIINKILSPEKIIKECLIYDLLNYEPTQKYSSVDEIIMIATDAFTKYQYKVGGYFIEDNEWIVADSNCHRFKVKENQKILYNSITKKNCDRETVWFLDSIMNYIKKHVDGKSVNVRYSLFEDEKNFTCWIIFKFDLKEKN